MLNTDPLLAKGAGRERVGAGRLAGRERSNSGRLEDVMLLHIELPRSCSKQIEQTPITALKVFNSDFRMCISSSAAPRHDLATVHRHRRRMAIIIALIFLFLIIPH